MLFSWRLFVLVSFSSFHRFEPLLFLIQKVSFHNPIEILYDTALPEGKFNSKQSEIIVKQVFSQIWALKRMKFKCFQSGIGYFAIHKTFKQFVIHREVTLKRQRSQSFKMETDKFRKTNAGDIK